MPLVSDSTKFVFLSAIPYAFSLPHPHPPPSSPSPVTPDDILTSARQQIEYMLLSDADPDHLLTADEDVKSLIRTSLSHFFSHFPELLLRPHPRLHNTNVTILPYFATLDWFCLLLPQFNLMTDFVLHWSHISFPILTLLHSGISTTFHLRLIQVTSKVFEAVGYGTVIVPPPTKLLLLNAWLPFIQKMKPLFDSNGDGMDEDLCQTIQGAIVSMIVTLPSNDQARILAAWMESQHLGYPDLTEAFEIWCYRTKSSKRRLLHRLHSLPTSDLSA